MNSNPSHGHHRKGKKMNAITKAALVAVLVPLGLALAAGAAESADSGALPRAVDLQPLLERHWQDHLKDLEAQLAELGPSRILLRISG